MASQQTIYAEERWFSGFIAVLLVAALFFMLRWEMQGRYGFSDITILWDIDVATAASLAGWFAISGSRPTHRKLWKCSVFGALIGLATGFFIGVVVPFFLKSNLWPLAGIFFTMPVGIPLGTVGGLGFGLARRGRRRNFRPQ